jgi:orotidine-5'-phosphate decarboxylase
MEAKDRIFVALDTPDLKYALALSRDLLGFIGGVKLGKEFFTANGLDGVKKIARLGMPIFLDLKFHDIPNTVAGAIKSSLQVNPSIITVHASGGRAMLEAAAKIVEQKPAPKPLLIGVTLLTSIDYEDLSQIGITQPVEDHVLLLAELAKSSGLNGVVCSAKEISIIKQKFGGLLKIIVPGIRPNFSGQNDQKRFVTPLQAIKNGADLLVIGRPITESPDPVGAAMKIVTEINSA